MDSNNFEQDMLNSPMYVLGKVLLMVRCLSPDSADTIFRQAQVINRLRGPLADWKEREHKYELKDTL